MKKIISLIVVVLILCVCSFPVSGLSVRMMNFYSEAEYDEFFANQEMAERFVTRQSVTFLGDFKCMYGPPIYADFDSSSYRYVLTNESGAETVLAVDHTLKAKFDATELSKPSGMKTMVYIDNCPENGGYIDSAGFRYCYHANDDNTGRLGSIEWSVGYTLFKVYVDEDFRSNLTDDKITFHDLVLSASDTQQKQAMTIFENAMKDAGVKLTNNKLLIIVCIIVGVAVLIAALKFFVKRKVWQEE